VSGIAKLMISLLYGSGLRRIELARLRVKDIDFDLCQVQVWNGKGGKHRLVTLALKLLDPLRQQVQRVEGVLRDDRMVPSFGLAWMPGPLARKYPADGSSSF
jgi:integrase